MFLENKGCGRKDKWEMASGRFENHINVMNRLIFIGKFPGMQSLSPEEQAFPKTLETTLEVSSALLNAVRSDE